MTRLTCLISCLVVLPFIVLPLVRFAKSPVDENEAAKLKVLIVDGQNNHKWKETIPVLKHASRRRWVFEVTVSTSPRKGTKQDGWKDWNPKFSD